MFIGVYINMTNKDALLTVAMLSAFLSKAKKDYLDLISPFVLSSLPKSENKKIDILKLQNDLKDKYGIEDLPTHVIRTILRRYSKGTQNLVRKIDDEFYVKKIYDSREFNNKRDKMKEIINDIITALTEYLRTECGINHITDDDSQKRLIAFLNCYNYLIIKNIDDLKSITIKTDQNNYYIARFILKEKEKDSQIFGKVIELIKGFLVYKAIYFFSLDYKKTIDSKLKRTTFYFDTRLLIYALGYNRKEDKQAARELIQLIHENGGIIKTFVHNKNEVAGILTKYARDRDSRNCLSLEFLSENNYDEHDVLRLRDSLEKNLNNIGIEVVDTPEYGRISSEDPLEDKGYLDLDELKKRLEENIKYSDKSKDIAVENDVESISAISRLRGRQQPYSIENCKAIFVTTNLGIIRTLQELYNDRFSKGEISFAISDMDLTAILWLKCYDKKSNLPCLKLMESVYAACCPTQEIMESFIEKVSILEKEGQITNDEALYMRSQLVKKDVLELTENDPDKITLETVINVRERIKDSYLSKQNDEFKQKEARAYRKAEENALKESKNYEEKLILAARMIFFIMTLSGFYILVKDLITRNDLGIPSILMTTFGLIGFFESVHEKYGLVLKLIKNKARKKFDDIYAKRVEEIKAYFN